MTRINICKIDKRINICKIDKKINICKIDQKNQVFVKLAKTIIIYVFAPIMEGNWTIPLDLTVFSN